MLGRLFFVRMLEYLDADDVIVDLVGPGLIKGTELHKRCHGSRQLAHSFLESILG